MVELGTPYCRRCVAAIAILWAVLPGPPHARASTAAFCGVVEELSEAGANDPSCLKRFTVRISYLDYISWGGFGAHSA